MQRVWKSRSAYQKLWYILYSHGDGTWKFHLFFFFLKGWSKTHKVLMKNEWRKKPPNGEKPFPWLGRRRTKENGFWREGTTQSLSWARKTHPPLPTSLRGFARSPDAALGETEAECLSSRDGLGCARNRLTRGNVSFVRWHFLLPAQFATFNTRART